MNRSKKILFTFIFGCFLSSAIAQFGVNVQYQDNDYKSWNEVINSTGLNENHELFKRNFKIGVDYSFDMAMYRVSFFPEISYAWSDFSFTKSSDSKDYTFNLTQYAFNFKTQVYPLDLLSKKSSQCPSFHRGMDKFTKGWYLLVFPELVFSDKKGNYTDNQDQVTEFNDPGYSFKFGIGTGIDLGISKHISISPYVMYLFTVGEKWEGFSQNGFGQPSFNDGTEVGTLAIGVRVGFWF